MFLPRTSCSPAATIAVLDRKFKRQVATRKSKKWVRMNYQRFGSPLRPLRPSRNVPDYACRGRGRCAARDGRHRPESAGFGFNRGTTIAVSRSSTFSIRSSGRGSITRDCLRYRPPCPHRIQPLFQAESSSRCLVRSSATNRGRAVSAGPGRAKAPPHGRRGRRVRRRVRRLPRRLVLGDPAKIPPPSALTRREKSTRPPCWERARGGSCDESGD
jgi:hypothetical protein